MPLTKSFAWSVYFGAWVFLSVAALAEEETGPVQILQSRGVDQRVDYASLTNFGPWDDRNYALTAEDLEYLAPDEDKLHVPIPAFFRVELRKEMPHLRRSGPAQYPRAALQLFELRYCELMRDGMGENGRRESQSDEPSGRCKESETEQKRRQQRI